MNSPGKKILLVGLRYHDYTHQIVVALQAQGHEVSYHEIQPRDLLMKTLRVVAPGWYTRRIDRHHERILAAERGRHYDLVLFIQVHQMRVDMLERFRQAFERAEFVLYNWDSLTTHDYRPHRHLFDRIYTFDPQDARALGVNYLPLFCIPAFQGLRKRDGGRPSIYFVGNIVSVQRYDAIHRFKRHCEREGIEFKSFLACSPVVLLRLLRGGRLPLDVSLRSIPWPRFIDMIETSTAVFDFANHRQSGYTMRTMENLCAGKKIITNNAGIRDEPFFSADRIHVFKDLEFDGVKAFLDRPLLAPDERFGEFHVGSFVGRLVDGRASDAATARCAA